MAKVEERLSSYPLISKWLGSWLEQLNGMGNPSDYRVILSEFEEQCSQDLKRLEEHLGLACKNCANFVSVFSEKQSLGEDINEANARILDKLAEIRAVIGLSRFGFKDIEFIGTPDFAASSGNKRFLVEVTRLGASKGERADVWDDTPSGSVSVMYGDGKSNERLEYAIYHEAVYKYQQFKKPTIQSDGWIVWVSLGRDYLTAGKYELPGVSTWVQMSIPERALNHALEQIRCTGSYSNLSHVVLSLGRDNKDLISPEFNISD